MNYSFNNIALIIITASLIYSQILVHDASLKQFDKTVDNLDEIKDVDSLKLLEPLNGNCFTWPFNKKVSWWQYTWCYKQYVEQMHGKQVNIIGLFKDEEIMKTDDNQDKGEVTVKQTYTSEDIDCFDKHKNEKIHRSINVIINCCDSEKQQSNTFITKVEEMKTCFYQISVCSNYLCNSQNNNFNNINNENKNENLNDKNIKIFNNSDLDELNIITSIERQKELLERTKNVFIEGYDAYMKYGFPEGDLLPLSCKGAPFDLIKIPLVTLIDSADMLVIMGNYTEFKKVINTISAHYKSFHIDVNVSVFETTIRILGGLLSAHLMAIDPKLNIYNSSDEIYDGSLLTLAVDLANRLIPAFNTKTSIPYGTVNLKYGVPNGETDVASTAGSGSLFIEFTILSYLTGKKHYSELALAATKALHSKRSALGLLGKHISTSSGRWSEQISGIGSNSDSYYEYLMKGYILSRNEELFSMFIDSFFSIKKYIQTDDWFGDVDMFTGKSRRNKVENLHAFWPGVESLLGFTQSASKILNSLYSIWITIGFLPEEIDQLLWLQKKIPPVMIYPLRPELIESTYYQYRSTNDRSWLTAGEIFLRNIEKYSKTKCGYASIKNFFNIELIDNMPSFFLSETCKYLYLLYDENNFIHKRSYIFSTEAHPFDINQIMIESKKVNQNNKHSNIPINNKMNLTKSNLKSTNFLDLLFGLRRKGLDILSSNNHSTILKLPKKCPKSIWWDNPSYFNMNYYDILLSSNKTQTIKLQKFWDLLYNLIYTYESINNNTVEYDDINDIFLDDPHSLADESLHKLTTLKNNHNKMLFDNIHSNSLYSSNHENQDDICKPNEKPVQSSKNIDINRNSILDKILHAIPKQSLNVPMGQLGNFKIDVFSDGFRIHNDEENRTLEISGLSTTSVIVREHNLTSNIYIWSDNDLVINRCFVEVLNKKNTIIWKKPCLKASYGPNNVDEIKAELYIPSSDNKRLCQPYIRNNTTVPMMTLNNKQDNQNNNNNKFKMNPIDWIWQWNLNNKKRKLMSEIENIKTDVGVSTEYFENKIYLVDRGECMFEDKSLNAQLSGAQALIVKNIDDTLFMMSGKGLLKEESHVDSNNNSDDISENQQEMLIPSVMISNSDGNELENLMYESSEYLVRLKILSNMSVLDTEAMGSYEYPKLSSQKNLINVLSSGDWGIVLLASDGVEWKLFIMEKSAMDFTSFNNWIINRKTNENFIVTTSFMTANQLDMYYYHHSGICPSNIYVKSDLIISK